MVTVAGADPTAGAGIGQDLKVFHTLGVWGAMVVAAITVQDGRGVARWQAVEAPLVEEQLRAALASTGARVVKTGMLGDAPVVEAVARVVEESGVLCVCDPVVRSGSGAPLISQEGVEALRKRLLPRAALITPNIPEARLLSGVEVEGPEGVEEAARRLSRKAGCGVLVTGGHGAGEEVEELLIIPDEGEWRFHHRRLANRTGIHGTGCALSAAVAGFLARGLALRRAVEEAVGFMERALASPLELTSGLEAVDTITPGSIHGERYRVLEALEEAWERLSALPNGGDLIPEIQSNLAYCLPGASSPEEVAAFPGRIVRMGKGVARLGCPRFGASSHVARIVVTAHAHDPSIRAAMALRYRPRFIQRAQSLGWQVGSFSRAEEPREVKEREGSTLVWGVEAAIAGLGLVPRLIYDLGEVGKEPVIRLLGRDPVEVVELAALLLRG